MMKLTAEQLTCMSRLFSSSVIREMARTGKSRLFARLAAQTHLLDSLPESLRVRNLFDTALTHLKKVGCRDEYVYKAALTHRILLGVHSLRTASMLSEFRVGECKADLAILNGTSTVYEVKSERDSLSRLDRQIDAYAKVFARVYVIAGENHIGAIMASVPAYVGILRLNSRHQISTVREAAERSEHTLPAAIFDSIRTLEARMILQSRGVTIPIVPNTELNSALRGLFIKLDPRAAHEGMVQVLKRTRNLLPLSHLVNDLPASLQPAALSVPLRNVDHARLVAAVNTPLKDAMGWA